MTPDVNEVLNDIRLELAKSEAASGPETPEVKDTSHLAGEPGVGEADNISDANDAVDKFLADVVDQLMLVTGMSEGAAFDFVFDFLDSESVSEHLPAIPDDDADPEELATWLGKAGTLGVAAKIIKAASRGG